MNSTHVMKFSDQYLVHRYSLIHFNFFIKYAQVAGIKVDVVTPTDEIFVSDDKLIFSCTINDQQIIVDYADHSSKNWQTDYPGIPYFKFQTNMPVPDGCIPLGPPMVGVKRTGTKGATLREYLRTKENYNYQPGHLILCKQLPNGAATERRHHVHQLLQDNFYSVDVTADHNQEEFWLAHQHCLAAVCVPGATNNMVDRGHAELLGLGVCTISPKLHTVFPWHNQLVPDTHYIQCRDDYSDLVDILQWLVVDTSRSKLIGRQAQQFYESYYTPQQYWNWILENLK